MVLVVSLSLFYGHKLDYCGELWMQLDTGVYLPVWFILLVSSAHICHSSMLQVNAKAQVQKESIGKKKAYIALKATSDEMLS